MNRTTTHVVVLKYVHMCTFHSFDMRMSREGKQSIVRLTSWFQSIIGVSKSLERNETIQVNP
jgi:hypothetical protein